MNEDASGVWTREQDILYYFLPCFVFQI